MGSVCEGTIKPLSRKEVKRAGSFQDTSRSRHSSGMVSHNYLVYWSSRHNPGLCAINRSTYSIFKMHYTVQFFTYQSIYVIASSGDNAPKRDNCVPHSKLQLDCQSSEVKHWLGLII